MRKKTWMSTIFIQHSTGNFHHRYKKMKKNKRYPKQKKRGKTVTICNYVLLFITGFYIQKTLKTLQKKNTQKLLELIHESAKLQDIKFIYKNLLYFNALIITFIKGKLRKQSQCHKIYLGINLTMELKDLYCANSQIVTLETEKDTNTWKDTPCSWSRRINIVQILILPKSIHRFNVISIKIPMMFLENQNK